MEEEVGKEKKPGARGRGNRKEKREEGRRKETGKLREERVERESACPPSH